MYRLENTRLKTPWAAGNGPPRSRQRQGAARCPRGGAVSSSGRPFGTDDGPRSADRVRRRLPEVRAVYDDIMATRKVPSVNNFWKVLAHDPANLARVWAQVKSVMADGALDPLVKEMLYIAVSVTNNCEYCIHSHTAAARGKGMTPAMFHELLAVVALANETNRFANGYRIDVDEQFRDPLGMTPTDAARRGAATTRRCIRSIEPYASGRIALDALHTMHWETCGNPDGVPLVFLHGGPGGGCLPHHRRFYDPAFFRIVLYDQRGCGALDADRVARSTTRRRISSPISSACASRSASSAGLVFGGSWGSTLALAYAQAHPDRVLGLVLRGIFLATHREIDWFMHGIAQRLSRGVARVRGVPSARRARRSPRQLLSPADRSRPGGAPARGAGVGSLRRRVLDAAAAARRDREVRQRRRGARHRAPRGALLRPPRIPARRRAARGRAAHPPHPLHHRAGPLRHRVPAGHRRHACPRVARGRVRRRARRRALGARARHHPRAGGRRPAPAAQRLT